MIMHVVDEDIAFYPYILNRTNNFDNLEIAYYIERLLSSGIKEKMIQKKLALNSSEYKNYNFEYNLFDVLQNSQTVTYEYLKDISKIDNEVLRDEVLDYIVQTLTTQEEIEKYLVQIKEQNIGSKYSFKTDGFKVKKNGHKTTIEIDERFLDFSEIRRVYDFIGHEVS